MEKRKRKIIIATVRSVPIGSDNNHDVPEIIIIINIILLLMPCLMILTQMLMLMPP